MTLPYSYEVENKSRFDDIILSIWFATCWLFIYTETGRQLAKGVFSASPSA
jgi:hypothetical protein